MMAGHGNVVIDRAQRGDPCVDRIDDIAAAADGVRAVSIGSAHPIAKTGAELLIVKRVFADNNRVCRAISDLRDVNAAFDLEDPLLSEATLADVAEVLGAAAKA